MNESAGLSHEPENRFLEHPTVEVQRHRGHVVSAYVKLQNRKAVRDIQPNPDHPVFFYLDEEGWPVGAKFYAPVAGYIVVGLLFTIVVDGDGKPHSVGQHVHCDFIPMAKALNEAMTEANERLQPEAAGV